MSNKTRMTPSEAFVETLVAHGVTTVFGIAGCRHQRLTPAPESRTGSLSGRSSVLRETSLRTARALGGARVHARTTRRNQNW